MRLVLTDPGRARVIAVLPAELVAEAARNPAYASLSLWFSEADAYEGDAPPAGLTPVDRANPVVPATEALWLYANRRRREISEGVDGTAGRLIPVTLPGIGEISVPIDATTRAALGDAAFQTTLPGGEAYRIEAWLCPNGQFVALDAEAIMALATPVAAAFQSLFKAQARAAAGIADGTVTTREQVEAILAEV